MKLKTNNQRITRFEINGNVYRVVNSVVDFKEADVEIAKQLGFFEFEKRVVEVKEEVVNDVVEEAATKKTSKKKEVNADKSE